jgi:hypothetical protein
LAVRVTDEPVEYPVPDPVLFEFQPAKSKPVFERLPVPTVAVDTPVRSEGVEPVPVFAL